MNVPKSAPSGRQHGAATAELAIVLPLLLVLSIAVVDFGLAVRSYDALAYAAREGTRYASVRSSVSRDPATLDKIASRVRSQLVLLNENALSVSAQWLPSNTRGGSVRVDVTYPYTPLTPLLPFTTLTLRSSAQMIISE